MTIGSDSDNTTDKYNTLLGRFIKHCLECEAVEFISRHFRVDDQVTWDIRHENGKYALLICDSGEYDIEQVCDEIGVPSMCYFHKIS